MAVLPTMIFGRNTRGWMKSGEEESGRRRGIRRKREREREKEEETATASVAAVATSVVVAAAVITMDAVVRSDDV